MRPDERRPGPLGPGRPDDEVFHHHRHLEATPAEWREADVRILRNAAAILNHAAAGDPVWRDDSVLEALAMVLRIVAIRLENGVHDDRSAA